MYEIKSRKELISEIALALQTNYDEGCFYLNLTTQEVGFHAPASLVGEDCIWPHMGDEVIRIDTLSSRDSFQAMEEFADKQPEKIADKLYHSLNGSRPFARFKAAVDILDRYAFKDEYYMSCPTPCKESLTVADTEMDSRHFMDFFNHAMQGKRIP